MGSLSSLEQQKLAYFHALGKVMTEDTQAVYESSYKSSHNIRLSDVWSDNVGYAPDLATAINESLTNSAVTYFNNVPLTMIYGSNGEAYAFISGGTFKDNTYPLAERGQLTSGATFIRPYISPVDIPQFGTDQPSNGYQLTLFYGLDANPASIAPANPGDQIPISTGAWSVDYYAGIVHFSKDTVDYTPATLGWGTITASFFQYTGHFGASGQGFTSAEFDSGTTSLIFDKNTPSQVSVDLSFLKDKLPTTNIGMTANITNSASTLACNTGITNSMIANSSIRVQINGVEAVVGIECYFSADGGVTQRIPGTEKMGDLLYWIYDVSGNPVSGYDLSTTDLVTFLYLTNN